MKGDHLSARQLRFKDEYLIDLNATQAAIRAGYSAKWAASNIDKLLKNKKIKVAIEEGLAEKKKRAEITADMVIKEIAKVAFFDFRKMFNEDGSLKAPHELDDDTASSISGIDTFEEFDGRGAEKVKVGISRKIRGWDKVKALELLGRHFSLFNDKLSLKAEVEMKNDPDLEEILNDDGMRKMLADLYTRAHCLRMEKAGKK